MNCDKCGNDPKTYDCPEPQCEGRVASSANSELLSSVKCPECRSEDLEWHCTQSTNSGVVDGRLRMHDIHTLFYLGCNQCSGTIKTINGDQVAALMTQEMKRR